MIVPGTRRAADRFVRASYYAKILPNPTTDRQAIANVMSVMRNTSVPFSEADPNAPNLSTTIWRTVVDHANRIYYFESTLSPNIVWMSLDKLNFEEGASVMKLALVEKFELVGDVSDKFITAEPFVFA